MVTRDLLPLIRWAHANGWTHKRVGARYVRYGGAIHEWRRGNVKVVLVGWHELTDIDGHQYAPDVAVWERVDPVSGSGHQVVCVDASSVAIVVRVLLAVEILPASWRRTVTARPAPKQLRGQLELISA